VSIQPSTKALFLDRARVNVTGSNRVNHIHVFLQERLNTAEGALSASLSSAAAARDSFTTDLFSARSDLFLAREDAARRAHEVQQKRQNNDVYFKHCFDSKVVNLYVYSYVCVSI